jgi:YgiT-type zinc finger domain-containing protein
MDGIRKEAPMKCVVCNGSDITQKSVDEEIKAGRDIVLLTLEVFVCASCGERYYDQKTMRKIEEIRARLKNKELEVEQVGTVYRAKAA